MSARHGLELFGRLAALLTAGSLLLMCDGTYAMDKAEPCRNAGYAIASRVHACTGDTERANQLYNRFAEELHCSISEPVATDFRCAYHINSYDCDQVEANGDDFDKWLNTGGCSNILRYASGDLVPTPAVSDAGASVWSQDPECGDVLNALGELVIACNFNPLNQTPQQIIDEQLAELEQTHECALEAGARERDACIADLDAAICLEVGTRGSFTDLLALAPACASVVPAKGTSSDAGADQ